MTRVQYEWTGKDNKTKAIVNTWNEAKQLVSKFGGSYKVKYSTIKSLEEVSKS